MKLYEIERYSATHPDWEGSFSERLYEHNEWNIDAFWKLHKELADLAIWLKTYDEVDKQLFGKLLGIQKSVWMMVASHFNKNDTVLINGVTDEELQEFIERFDMVFLAISTGNILPESSFDLVNPLIKNNQD
ncbi:Imm41 family immunity protein [uncultured Shewanella sp.]|uniref:Imm41 family immunity protein n=1 Tax=uncultured Shewanella sp. TaxID=173975 RepID=UPI0026054738|nr:Imm41 family immunity protein [uncultured Shewanella sp.]